MNLDDFNVKNLVNSLSNNSFSNIISDFIKELSGHLQNNNNERIANLNKEMQEYYNEREKIMNTTKLEEEKTYVVSGIKDNSITVVDIENGDEIRVYISTNDEELRELNGDGIYDRIYMMNESEFLNLNLTDNIILKDNQLYSNSEKIKITNNLALRLLEDLYMQERQTEGQQYRVTEIKDNKIYLTNSDGTGGYFPIHKELYPEFEVGDIVQKNNKKYSKVE